LRRNKCNKCGKRFHKIEELMQHTQVLHGKDIFYQCRKCNVSFQGMEQMRDHARKFHTYNKINREHGNHEKASGHKTEDF
jgi:KRAB domain-containing zinc finger protein